MPLPDTTQVDLAQLKQLFEDAIERGLDASVTVEGTSFSVPSAVLGRLVQALSEVDGPSGDLPRTITTGQAADLLGVSRPTVIALIEKGELTASRVGSRRRLNTDEVLAFKSKSQIRPTLNRIVEISEEIGLYDE